MTIRIALCLILLAAALHAEDAPRIRKIYVEPLNVFEGPEFEAWYYRWANHLHIKTRPSFIRRDLLVREGDPLDEDLLRESERNLRRYGFLTDAEIKTVAVREALVDLYVRTEDQWTLKIDVSYGVSRGAHTYDVGIEESNFLGLGRTIGAKLESNVERDSFRVYYGDPRLFNSRWALTASVLNATDGFEYISTLDLPLWSEASRWSVTSGWRKLKQDEHYYLNGVEAAFQELNYDATSLAVQHAWGPRYHRYLAGGYAGYYETIYPGSAVILDPEAAADEEVARNLNPPDQRVLQAGPTAGFNFQKYVTRRYLDSFGPTEDLPVGPLLNVAYLRSENLEGADYSQWSTGGRTAFASGDRHYYILTGDVGIRHQAGEWNNFLAHVKARAYYQHGEASMGFFRSKHQTYAAAITTVFSRNVDAPFQVSLGEDEGLRGYKHKSFVGTNSALLNLEERIFTPIENGFLGLAVVPFVDAGTVWGGGSSWIGGVSTGIGLRIGFKKLRGNHVLRVDFAWPLVHATDRGISISFSGTQIFRALD